MSIRIRIGGLLAQKSEQYVQERLEHETTKREAAATIARLETERDEAERQRQTWVSLHGTLVLENQRLEAELVGAKRAHTIAFNMVMRLEAENARLMGLLREALPSVAVDGDDVTKLWERIRSAIAAAQPASTERLALKLNVSKEWRAKMAELEGGSYLGVAGIFALDPGLCSDCPPRDYPTDNTRCVPCPRRWPQEQKG